MAANGGLPAVILATGAAVLLSVGSVATSPPTAAATAPDAAGRTAMVTSADGTRIAIETQGSGPVVIVIGGALSDRAGGAGLAKRLATDFTVVTFDRRGRGDSGDTAPYAIAREVEDVAAVIDAAGGAAALYGVSSGAVLALHAAAGLDDKVTKLALYEPPFDDADGVAGAWRAFTREIDALLAADRREDAVVRFLGNVGMPDAAVATMKATPAWAGMVAMAPTLAYDNTLLGDRRVPVDVATMIDAPSLVLDGAASAATMPFMKTSADTLAEAMPDARRRTVEGQGHAADPAVVAPILREFVGR